MVKVGYRIFTFLAALATAAASVAAGGGGGGVAAFQNVRCRFNSN